MRMVVIKNKNSLVYTITKSITKHKKNVTVIFQLFYSPINTYAGKIHC